MRLGDHCGLFLSELANHDPRIWVLDGDLADSDGAVHFAEAHPERFIMAGASEQCMVSMASGLASCGLRPWVFSFAAFVCYRAYDQIRVCVSQAKQSVAIVGSHSGGCGGRNGKTHLSLNDLALMVSLPEFQVWAPASPSDVRLAVRAILEEERPAYVRLPRMPLGELPGEPAACRWITTSGHVNFVTSGLGTHLALGAISELASVGVEAGLLHCARVFPVPDEARRVAKESQLVVVVEDHYRVGGLSSLLENDVRERVLALGWRSDWAGKSGSESEVLGGQGLSPNQICSAVLAYQEQHEGARRRASRSERS